MARARARAGTLGPDNMGYIEQTIVDWINEDDERLNGFLHLLGDHQEEEDGFSAMREMLSGLAPACGKFWQDLILSAIAVADWKEIATEITDRRGLDAEGGAWVMVDRRKS